MEMDDVNEHNLAGFIRDLERSGRHTTALAEAVRWSLKNEVSRLVESGVDVNAKTEQGSVALMLCTNTRIAQILLQQGADVNVRDTKGQTPLIRFLKMLVSPTRAEAYVRLLLKAGAQPDVEAHDGTSAFQLAQKKYGPRVADLLTPPAQADAEDTLSPRRAATAASDRDR